jgi:hypothetical protein
MNVPLGLRDTYTSAKKQAAKRGIAWDLSVDDLERLFRRSGGACEVSGIAFDWALWREGQRRPWAASIDRVQSDGYYTLKNCRLVCCAANLAMNEWGTTVLHRLARGVVEQREKFRPVSRQKPNVRVDLETTA